MVSVHPKYKYVKLDVGGEFWWVGEDLVETVMEKAKVESYSKVETLVGKKMLGWKYRHPFHDEDERDQIDRFDGNGREDQHERAIGPGEGVGQENAHHGTRSAERSTVEISRRDCESDHPDQVGKRGDQKASADTAEQVVT